MTELSPNGELVRCLLTDIAIVGATPDLSALTDSELGALAYLAWAPRTDQVQHRSLRAILRERTPSFSEANAVAALNSLTTNARQHPNDNEPPVVAWMVEAAAQVVSGCAAASEPQVQGALRALLELGMGPVPDLLGIALLSCAGLPTPEPQGELARSEQAYLRSLAAPQHRITLGRIRSMWTYGVDDEELTPRGADPLALLPGYLAFAEGLTAMALKRTQAIQSGAISYAADKAFQGDDPYAIHSALRAGLDQGAPWALESTIQLLAGLSVAPVEKAKTAPSQSAAIAIAKAIAERPTATIVADLKALVASVRHAGLKKKLDHFRVVAERRLLQHPDFLVDLNPDATVPKALSGAVARAFEALFLRSSPLPFEVWLAHILTNKATAAHATSLVWRSEGGATFVPVRQGKGWSFVSSDGTPLPLASGSITLWHPLQPNSDAAAWRAWVLKRKLSQPFNQLFRETYSPHNVPDLLVPELDVKTLLGLAHSQGWLLRDRRLLRAMGPYRVELDVGRVFPGATGTTRCGSIDLFQGAQSNSVDLSVADPQTVSECLRAVDLLVSVSAFALDPAQTRENTSARERRTVLESMLGISKRPDHPFVEAHHVRSGSLSINIATGRAARDGAEVDPPPVAAGVWVIPYPDEILSRIVSTLNAFGTPETGSGQASR